MASEKFISVSLDKYAVTKYRNYGIAVLEDRAIPDFRDGMNPVNRRVLWSAYELGIRSTSSFAKSARIVGDTLGRFHPHGDSSCYGAMVGMTNVGTTINNVQVGLLEGEGNWGGFSDKSYAAMRYCFTQDTRVMTEYGLESFEDLALRSGLKFKVSDQRDFTTLVSSRLKPLPTSHIVNSGKQKTVRVTTKSGYTVRCTPNEPFLTITPTGFKWKDAEDLSESDWLCFKRDHGLTKVGTRSDLLEARFLGYMVGDGYINSEYSMGFNQVDSEVFDDFVESARHVFPKGEHRLTIRDPSSYCVQQYNQWGLNKVTNTSKMAQLGLRKGNSYDRVVPKCVFKGTPEYVGQFLAALFESDGSLGSGGRGSSQLFLNSRSRRLLEETSLLLRTYFGIFTGAILADGELGLRFTINGKDNLTRFRDKVGFRSKRKTKQIKICTTGKSNADSIPYASDLGLTIYDKTQRETFRNKVKAGTLNPKASKAAVRAIYEADYYYEPVASVDEEKDAFVFDLSVPGSNAFTANGFVVHNTEARLSKFADAVLFNKFYLPVVEMGPNFDSKGKEPVLLPALMPIVFLNGRFGIAPGATTNIPSFSARSLIKALKLIYEGNEITSALLYKTFKFTTLFGGVERLDSMSDDDKQDRKRLFKTMNGKVTMYGNPVLDEKAKTIIVTRFGNSRVNIETLLANVLNMPGVQSAMDDSTKNDKYGTLKVVLKKGLKPAECEKLFKKIDNEISRRENYILNFTERYLDDNSQSQARMRPMSVTDAFTAWVEWRIELEKKACSYWIKEDAKQIRKLELLMIAVDNRALIIKSLDLDLDEVELDKWLANKLKITQAEAHFIYDLKVRQLRKLERKALEASMKQVVAHKKDLEKRHSKPLPYMTAQLKEFVALI